MKLTPAQKRALQVASDGMLVTPSDARRDVLTSLAKLGLLAHAPIVGYRITDAGRAAIGHTAPAVSAFHEKYHRDHRCNACGCKLDHHATVGNPHAKDGQCPTTVGYGSPAPFQCSPRHLDNAEFDRYAAKYWGTFTVFIPR